MSTEKVFIGGSRAIKHLDPQVRLRLDRIIAGRLSVLIGDANGADKAVQSYFHSQNYDQVEVFCMDGSCRNNLGGWKARSISSENSARGRGYFSLKDEAMTEESSVGLMLWDGHSAGTLANITRLIDLGKKVVVYVTPAQQFRTIRSQNEVQALLETVAKGSEYQRKAGNRRNARPSPRKGATVLY